MKTREILKNKEIMSWATYDWANSAFATTVMAGFFPVFFKKYWSSNLEVTQSTAYLGYLLGATSLLVAIVAPWLGYWADRHSGKKWGCAVATAIGVITCILLGWIGEGQWAMALIVYGFGMIAFNIALIFYDGLMSEVADSQNVDLVSSIGYSLGYLGGGILFLLNVLMYLFPQKWGFESGVEAIKWSFISVGLWWGIFSMPLLIWVPEKKKKIRDRMAPESAHSDLSEPAGQILRDGAQIKDNSNQFSLKLLGTLQRIFKNHPNTALYLVAYWLFIDGVYTVITMAVDFGVALGLESQHLIAALLITQFIGFPSAWLFGYLARKWKCKIPILICIGIYSLTVILATQMSKEIHFYLLASVIGLVQGGIQALTRSLFSKMIPSHQSGEYFGLFNLVGKFASILGPVIVAIGNQLTGSSQKGLLGLLILFISGGFLLLKVKEEPGLESKTNETT